MSRTPRRALEQLQSSRLLYEQLGKQLETLARSQQPNPNRDQILNAAAQSYQNAGDAAGELRIAAFSNSNGAPVLAPDRYAKLVMAAGGDLASRVAAIASTNPDLANHVVQYLIAHGDASNSFKAVDARGSALSPLWTRSYTALAGLYFLSPDPRVANAFETALGPRTAGEQLDQKDNRDQSLQGDIWFYYGARYGDYLAYRGQTGAGDFLPATVELSPAASDSYVVLGDTYKELKHVRRASEQYNKALELSPQRSDIYDRLAVLELSAQKHQQAIERWRQALRLLGARIEEGPLPPSFWSTAQDIFKHINGAGAVQNLKSDADGMLRAYVKRNGGYNLLPFFEGMLTGASNRAAVIERIIQITLAPNARYVLDQLLESPLLRSSEKEPVYRARIEQDRNELYSAAGYEANTVRQRLKEALIGYATYLDTENRFEDAWRILHEIDPPSEQPQILTLRLAALTGRLDQLLSQYRAGAASSPSGEQILALAGTLQAEGHSGPALELENFEYGRELDTGAASASVYFGLARVRIEQKRNSEALALIRDVTLSIGAPFENLPEAVRLLDQTGMKQQAANYALEWKTAEPWNPDAQLAYGRLTADAKVLDAVRTATTVPYATRVSAARVLRELQMPAPGSQELDLLTQKSFTAQQASQHFFVNARLDAAHDSNESAAKIKLLSEAIAIDPTLQDSRLFLAEAAFTLKRDALGLAAWESYQANLGTPPWRHSGYLRQTAAAPAASPQILRVEELVAAALVRRNQFDRAIDLYQSLIRWSPKNAATFETLRAHAEVENKLLIANAQRQPIVSKEVAQPIIVKPRLSTLPQSDSDFAVTSGGRQ